MSNLLLKAVQFKIREARRASQTRAKATRKEDLSSASRGGRKYLGDNLEVRYSKLPFVAAAEIVMTNNQRGVRVRRTVSYPEGYLNVSYAFADGVFNASIEEMKEEIKAI